MTDKITKQEKYRRGLIESKRQAARIPDLEAENAELRRRLEEIAAAPSILDKISPEARAEFNAQRDSKRFAGKSDDEAIAGYAEVTLRRLASIRAKKTAPVPTVALPPADKLTPEDIAALQDEIVKTDPPTKPKPRGTQIECMDSPADRLRLAEIDAALDGII